MIEPLFDIWFVRCAYSAPVAWGSWQGQWWEIGMEEYWAQEPQLGLALKSQ